MPGGHFPGATDRTARSNPDEPRLADDEDGGERDDAG